MEAKKPRTTSPRLTDLKRDAVVQAAIREFCRNGFDLTSMDRIAEAAGVSKRTVYNHFPSKDELFAEILTQLWQRSGQEQDMRYRPGQPIRTQLLAQVGHKLHVLSDENLLDLARIAMAATIHSPERAQGMVARIAEREQGMVAWIAAAQADGQLKPINPGVAAQQLHGLVKTFAFWPQVTLRQPALNPEQQQVVALAAVDMFLAAYATERSPAT